MRPFLLSRYLNRVNSIFFLPAEKYLTTSKKDLVIYFLSHKQLRNEGKHTTVLEILSRLRSTFLSDISVRKYDEEPFLSELFSAEQIDSHGPAIARVHRHHLISSRK